MHGTPYNGTLSTHRWTPNGFNARELLLALLTPSMGNFHLRFRIQQIVLISIPTLLGYGISTIFILVWLTNREKIHWRGYGFESDMLNYRYNHIVEYLDFMDVLELEIPSIFWVFIVAATSVLLVWVGTRSLNRLHFQDVSIEENKNIHRVWRTVLLEQRPKNAQWCGVFFLLGFAGAWFGVLVDNLIAYVRPDTLTLGGITYYGINTMPTPVVGWFTWSDGSFITLGILFTTYLMIVRPARKRFARSKYIAKRWCPSCGYPIAGISTTTQGPQCPECGAQRPQQG